jgi:hypothetical protein
VICDVSGFIHMEARVERVYDGSRDGNAKVRFHVGVVAAHQGRHRLTLLKAAPG